jgi:hypothetical protein
MIGTDAQRLNAWIEAEEYWSAWRAKNGLLTLQQERDNALKDQIAKILKNDAAASGHGHSHGAH